MNWKKFAFGFWQMSFHLISQKQTNSYTFNLGELTGARLMFIELRTHVFYTYVIKVGEHRARIKNESETTNTPRVTHVAMFSSSMFQTHHLPLHYRRHVHKKNYTPALAEPAFSSSKRDEMQAIKGGTL